MPKQIVELDVIRWKTGIDRWGMVIRYSDGLKHSYEVGNRLEAEQELARLKRLSALQRG